MSNRLSKPDRLRFSGPELGDLLDRVVNEHGEDAAIAAVNRVRSGGVAGFFCREEFEVIVDPDAEADADADASRGTDPASDQASDTTVDPASDPDTSSGTDRADGGKSTGSEPTVELSQAPGTVRYPNVVDEDDETIAEVIGRRGPDQEPPDRLARRALREELMVGGDAADSAIDREPGVEPPAETLAAPTVAEPVFGGPVPPGSDPGRDRFLALLERRLDEASAVEDDLQLRRARPTTAASGIDTAVATPVAPAPTPALSPSPTGPGATLDETRPVFWRRLDRVRAELASFVPSGSPRTAVVGPLPLAAAVVHRLQSSPDLASAEVVALTDRAGIVSEPSWRLERNGDRLIRSLAESPDRPVIVVIDVPVELPHWVGSLQRRLRSAGIGLFRYTVSGQPTGPDLERYRQGADVPYAIDLTSRVEPGLVSSLVADRHPIVSVAGADLGPELLLALRRHVGAAELLFEPVIDG